MKEDRTQLVVDLALGRLSESDFIARFGADPQNNPDVVRFELEGALAAQSAVAAECAVILALRFGLSRSYVPVLCDLLEEDWHHSHEDIASSLQDIRDASAVEALYRVTQRKLAYLDYNDGEALVVKCIWALHDIGTPEARVKLELLSASPSEAVCERAAKRLADLSNKRPDSPEQPYRLARNEWLRPNKR